MPIKLYRIDRMKFQVIMKITDPHGWIRKALNQGKLRITDNYNCPFCNPQHRTDIDTNLNACKEHKWVSRKWYENRFIISSRTKR